MEEKKDITATKEVKTEAKTENTRTGERKPFKKFDKPRRFTKNKFFSRKKFCFFCKNKDIEIDYKNVGLMRRFTAENGKITPRKFTGTCAKHQRSISNEIKKARQMALIKYTDMH